MDLTVKQHLAERLMNFLIHGVHFRFSVRRSQEADAFHEIAEWLDEALCEDSARLDYIEADGHPAISKVNKLWYVNFDMDRPFDDLRAAVDFARGETDGSTTQP